MSEATQAQREAEAIENCEEEEIQFVGNAQWYGWLLATDSRLENVTHVSANVTEHTGLPTDAILGSPLTSFLEREIVHDLRNAIGHSTITVQREHVGSVVIGSGTFDIALHQVDDAAIIEFVPAQNDVDAATAFSRAQTLLTRLSRIQSVDELVESAVAELRWFTAYDRVKTYRFLPDGSGEVVAEDRLPDVDSFLGLRFPSIDIPQSARRLYTATPMRLISDVSGPNAPIFANDDSNVELDLSLALLRGTVDVHTVYLQNMGVKATLSLPIVVDGRMWGLFAFHHHEPKSLSSPMGLVCELLGRSISIMLQAALERERRRELDRCMLAARTLFGPNDTPIGFGAYWESASDELQRLVECDGIAFVQPDQVSTFGSCPPDASIRLLAGHYRDLNLIDLSTSGRSETAADDGTSIFQQPLETLESSDSLSEVMPGVEFGPAAGALVLVDPVPLSDALIFFRNETKESVRWAGNPTKDLEEHADGLRLNPRSSFSEYLDSTKGTSKSWETKDLEVGAALAEALRRTYWTSELRKINADRMGLMVRELNHRVRNILALIQSLVGQSQMSAASLPDYVEGLERRIHALARAHNLLTESDWSSVSIQDLFESTLDPYRIQATEAITLEGDLARVDAPVASALTLVVHELASNAAKYGALSVESGRVALAWVYEPDGFIIEWTESAGPRVSPPTREGFGTSVITESLAFEFGATVDLDFAETGVTARIVLPAELVRPERGSTGPPGADSPAVTIDLAIDSDRPHVLVVEDDFIIAKDTVARLHRVLASEVVVESSVESALAAVEANVFDFVLLDVNLGGTFSSAVAAELNARQIPFVFVTGYGSRDQELQSFQPLDVVTKPLTEDRLREALAAGGLVGRAEHP